MKNFDSRFTRWTDAVFFETGKNEAAIGKIAGEQIVKLCTLGLTEQETEEKIIDGFLKG